MRILVIGNGFDLAHGLPTKYTDFLEFCRMIIEAHKLEKKQELDVTWKKLSLNVSSNKEGLRELFEQLIMEKKQVKCSDGKYEIVLPTPYDEFWNSINTNDWVEYFLESDMHGAENWIDFESEISTVIQSLDNDLGDHSIYHEITKLSNEFFYNKYGHSTSSYVPDLDEEENYRSSSMSFKHLRDKLIIDLGRLDRALEIYLIKYVGNITPKKVLPDIRDLCFDRVLSFNYTHTYQSIYDDKKEGLFKIEYIHGDAQVSHTIDNNNFVLGIDEYLPLEERNKRVEFIAFKKFYQRIHNEIGCEYKDWVSEIKSNKKKPQNMSCFNVNNGKIKSLVAAEFHELYIFGHSLDITDGDILRELILNENVHTTIFYLNKDVMGQQIANLVKVIGEEELIKRTGGKHKTIEFRKQGESVSWTNEVF